MKVSFLFTTQIYTHRQTYSNHHIIYTRTHIQTHKHTKKKQKKPKETSKNKHFKNALKKRKKQRKLMENRCLPKCFRLFFHLALRSWFLRPNFLSTIILPPITPDHVKNVQIVRSITFNVLFEKPQKYFRNMTLSKVMCDHPLALWFFIKTFFLRMNISLIRWTDCKCVW